MNRIKHTFNKLYNLANLPMYNKSELELIDYVEFIKENIPMAFEEMTANKNYKKWLDPYPKCGYVDIIYDNGKKVGFASYSFDLESPLIVLDTIYILEKYRGNRIFINYFKRICYEFMLKHQIGDYTGILISKPNKYLINSLINGRLLFPIADGLYASLVYGFLIKFKDPFGNTFGKPTFYYSKYLSSPCNTVETFSGFKELIYSPLNYIDIDDFNAEHMREEFLKDSEKIDNLKITMAQWDNEIINLLKESEVEL